MPVATGHQRSRVLPREGRTRPARVIRRQVPSFAVKGMPGPRWWPLLQQAPALAALRTDAYANLLKVAWALALGARGDGTVAPTWEGLSEATGLSRASIARHLLWLRQHHLIAVQETGSTPRTRGRFSTGGGNHAAVYALTIPRPVSVERSETPTCSLVERTPNARARHENGTPAASGGGRWSPHKRPRTRAERLAAAEIAQTRVIALRRCSTRAVRHALRPWFLAGWTVADLVWALDHDPDANPRWQTRDVRHPLGWLNSRLKPWQGLEPPSRKREQERAALRAAQLEERARREADRAGAVPMPAGFRDLLRKSRQSPEGSGA